MTEEKNISIDKSLEDLNENYDKSISQQNLKKEINQDEFDLENFGETEKEEEEYNSSENKYIMNPTYTSEGVDVEILTEWQYANTTDRLVDVAPYGGGSIRNGVKLWEYILGRGNSFLEHDESDENFSY